MGQMGFFDLANRYAGLDAKNEPLVKIDGLVPWEDFRRRLEAVWRCPDKARKSRARRKPWDAVGDVQDDHSVRTLQSLGRPGRASDPRDRLSFMRFLGLEDRVPDAKTVWLYREQLTQAGVIEALFETFDGHLKDQGYLAMGGQIVDGMDAPPDGIAMCQVGSFVSAKRGRGRPWKRLPSSESIWRRTAFSCTARGLMDPSRSARN